MKRILIDVNAIVNGLVTGKKTGIGRTTLELIQALEQIDELPFELTLYSQNMKGIGASFFSDKFNKSHFYLPYRKPLNKIFGKIPIKEFVHSYDLMHIPTNYGYVYAPHKTIFTLHDAFFMRIDDENFNYHQMRQEVPNILKKAKGIVTCSNYSKKDIIETMDIDPKKVNVIYWGYNNNIFKPKKENKFNYLQNKFKLNNNYFLSYSCNTGRKNTDKLIKAFIKYLNNRGENDLVLIWSNPPQELQEIISKSGFKEKIHFLEDIDDFHLSMLLQHSSAMIYPSSYEGFGLPVLEALACGTLVLTGNNSSLPEVGGDAAFYMDDLSVDGIFLGILNMGDSINKKDIYVERGLKHARKFSWKKTANDYIDLYKEYLEK